MDRVGISIETQQYKSLKNWKESKWLKKTPKKTLILIWADPSDPAFINPTQSIFFKRFFHLRFQD